VRLAELLDLEQLDKNLFRGRQPDTDRQRVFGGQVAAQALVAGVRTVDPAYVVHSLHSYFLRPGDTSVPIVYDAEALRDGRSFATRRVVARQHGRPIYYQTANFQKPEDGIEHQDVMPDVIAPEEGLDLAALMRGSDDADADALAKEWASLDARYVGNSRHGLSEDPNRPSLSRMWVRVQDGLGDDPRVHLAAFTYASDMSLLGATLAAHDVSPRQVQMASLDHTIWFHRPFRADEWWLYDQHSPSAQGGRGLAFAEVFTQDGRLVASVAQEGLIRVRR
jgi:acyl-CoA thioesterase-2